MLLSDLVETSRQVAATSGRLAKIALLADLLKRAGPEEVETVIAYLSGAVPQRVGVGWATLQAARVQPAREAMVEVVEGVEVLNAVARAVGRGSAAAKTKLLRDLFARATAEEQDFLVRLLTGELRQGALEGLMVEAVAKALELPAADVRRAVMLAGNLGAVARGDLASFSIELFRPIQPMLAKTATHVSDALAQLGPAAFEHKLDGLRVQVHRTARDVRVYSRLLNDITEDVPEVVDVVKDLKVQDVILDGEALALTTDNRPLPFQETMRKSVTIVPFFFDILYVDGTSLLDQPYATRSRVLAERVPESHRPPRLVTADAQEAEAFFEQAIAAGHEGLMAKGLETPYVAGRRAGAWIKIKRANTLDLVVLAAEWGHGRRHGWLSNLHLGARDPAGGFVMLGKTFKGMTDELLKWQTTKLQELKVREVGNGVEVRPELVVEIAFNGLQASTRYPGGLALRFARVIRYRSDKKPDEADTIETVRLLAGLPAASSPPHRGQSGARPA
ncbi:MAG: ATP-dependent DNA ligase [Gemmatimonadales bacterium]